MSLFVVLVRSIYSSNVGTCARALANMGGQQLILIDPRCEIDSKARSGAAGAQEALGSMLIYENWDSFYRTHGDGVRIGMTKRSGRKRTLWPLQEKIKAFQNLPQSSSPLYLFFGPEDDGLSSDDLALMNFCCSLPTYGDFSSLNLAQAVLLTLFICQQELGAETTQPNIQKKSYAPNRLKFPDKAIRDWLETMGFDITARRASAYITLRRLLLQNLPTDYELMILESILHQNIRKLKEGSKEPSI